MTNTAETDYLTPEQARALASPLRLEIVGLFGGERRLSIADMAERMGVRAGSLYHHVGRLESVGILRRDGTRRKGKRDEALFTVALEVLELELDTKDAEANDRARRAIGSAFRMAERDFSCALERDDLRIEGEDRNFIAARFHLRASPRVLARVNKHLDAVYDLLVREGGRRRPKPGPDDQYLSLTFALLPLRNRRQGENDR